MSYFDTNTGLVSHAIGALAFLVLVGLLLMAGARTKIARWLLLTCLVSAGWAGVQALVYFGWPAWQAVASGLEILRSVAWILFLGGLAKSSVPWLKSTLSQKFMQILIGISVLTLVILDSTHDEFTGAGLPQILFQADMIGHLALSVAGLVLLENIFRNAEPESIWGIKFLILGCGAIFVYDFYLYSDALLLGEESAMVLAARGAVNTLAVPLIAVAAGRMRSWSIDIHVSRGAVFHTTTVVACGIYLIVMAAVGFHIRRVGGGWGALLQVLFLSAAILALLTALFSGSIRARLRVFIAKHFFTYRYDYRYEWHRFIGAMSTADGRLHERAVVAVANIVDSPAGAIWVRDRTGNVFEPAASWNFAEHLPNISADAELCELLRTDQKVVDLDEMSLPDLSGDKMLPKWFDDLPKPWLIVPCIHREEVQGFLVLSRSRAPQKLDWEEYDLLKTVGAQVASYLAEEAALHALVDVQQLERFNKRFAFVVHDIKNVVGQLSLMLSNAEKHGDNPEFQADVFRTVQNTVEKMSKLLGQLRQTQAEDGSVPVAIDLVEFVGRAAKNWSKVSANVTFACKLNGLPTQADPGKLSAVIDHLVQNAIDAAGADGKVILRLSEETDDVLLEISDDGPGMDPEFVRNDLFRPLRTTKGAGMGIGAYQTRELVRELGGSLEVDSSPGVGTRFIVRLRRASGMGEPAVLRAVQEG